ncbi:hypothetical protein [Ktedonospora formicarum]|uniref:Uncharacterized protein n=1 Tax=Ktedonospora formicarum TaxID=2778364 RepID=A0A8J3HZY5_9CHLR|nr:hypothetical protein [Ktedonospora formicarum]GHO45076.1 hypothetical protein KSX_32390 [Ktedonospora formicarum]
MREDHSDLRQSLQHVYWLGGSPCAGKSSTADFLVSRYGWRLYRCDDAYYEHCQAPDPERDSLLYRLSRLAHDALWLERSVEQQVREEYALYLEEWNWIVRDLQALPRDRPILVEGAALLPELVEPLLNVRSRALWMIPTGEFQRYHYSQRTWAWDAVRGCSDPARAFENWMQRDICFARTIEAEARRRGLKVLMVDGARTLPESMAYVERLLCGEGEANASAY